MITRNNFKPYLTINNKKGIVVSWQARLSGGRWGWSEKLEGVRIEIDLRTGKAYTRSLKPIRNKWLSAKVMEVVKESRYYGSDIIIEGEVFGGYDTFEEVKGWVAKKGSVSPLGYKWADNLSINLFDMFKHGDNNIKFVHRIATLIDIKDSLHDPFFKVVKQYPLKSISAVFKMFEIIVDRGGEGIMFKNLDAVYKHGRSTEKEATAFKLTDNAIEYSAVIIDVEEGTIVNPLAETGQNELGYSTTSKLKEDRLSSGRAKTLKCIVHIDDYFVEQSVSLSGFDNRDKEEMLAFKTDWIGKKIIVKGMKPTIVKGKVRGCSYRK